MCPGRHLLVKTACRSFWVLSLRLLGIFSVLVEPHQAGSVPATIRGKNGLPGSHSGAHPIPAFLGS